MNESDKRALRELLLQNKTMLKEIFLSNKLQVTKLLGTLNVTQINVLIRAISLVASGTVGIDKKDFAQIEKGRRTKYFHVMFGTAKATSRLLKLPRKEKLETIFKIAPFLVNILAIFFTEPEAPIKKEAKSIPVKMDEIIPKNVAIITDEDGQGQIDANPPNAQF